MPTIAVAEMFEIPHAARVVLSGNPFATASQAHNHGAIDPGASFIGVANVAPFRPTPGHERLYSWASTLYLARPPFIAK